MHVGRVLDQQPCAGNEIVVIVVKMVMTKEKLQAYAFYPNSKRNCDAIRDTEKKRKEKAEKRERL